MDWAELANWFTMAIPIATFLALVVSVYLFVKNKGTVDALKEVAATYKALNEALEKKNATLDLEVVQLRLEVRELRKEVTVLRRVIADALAANRQQVVDCLEDYLGEEGEK